MQSRLAVRGTSFAFWWATSTIAVSAVPADYMRTEYRVAEPVRAEEHGRAYLDAFTLDARTASCCEDRSNSCLETASLLPRVATPSDQERQGAQQDGGGSHNPTCVLKANQSPSSVQARFQVVKVNGTDDRLLAAATVFSDVEMSRYSSIGRTECPTGNGSTYVSTAFHVGSYRTMVTTAHSFSDPLTEQRIDPKSCLIRFFNRDGSMRETVTIDFVYSRWNDPGKFGDPSNDIAIIRLAGESKTPSNMPEAIVPNRLTKQSRVSTIGFHTDIPGNTLLKRVYGYAIQPSSTAYLSAAVSKAGRPTWNIENIAVVSYDSGQGASGSPVLNAQGQIIGLHQGSHGRRGVEFDQFSSYNRAVTFDQRFADDLNAVLAECCRKSP